MTTTEMVVKQSDLVNLLTKLGFSGVERWTEARLQGKVKGLLELEKVDPKAFDELEDDESDLVDDLVEAANNRVTVDIEMDMKKPAKGGSKSKKKPEPAVEDDVDDEGEVEAEEKPAPKRKRSAKSKPAAEKKTSTKKPAAEKKSSKKKAAAKDGNGAVERDRFGSKVGTQCATINAAMSKKPQTAAAIAEKVELSVTRVSGHLRYLIERGYAEKVEGKGVKVK